MQCTDHTVPVFYKLDEADLCNMSPLSSTLHMLHSLALYNMKMYVYCTRLTCPYLWQWNLMYHCGHNRNEIYHFSAPY